MAWDISEAVMDALNENLDATHQLKEKGPFVHERSHGFVSFECEPVAAWDKVFEVDGVRSQLTGSILVLVEYDPSLKSQSPEGSAAVKEWAEAGGSPELEDLVAPVVVEAGYFKRKLGMGFSDETRTDIGMGDVRVVDANENIELELENGADAGERMRNLIDDLMAHPPAGATEPLKGKARKRERVRTEARP